MEPWAFEDYEVGKLLQTASRTVTDSDVDGFVRLTGLFEPLFIDRVYLREKTAFAGRVVPGMLTVCVAEGLITATGLLHGKGLALLGMDTIKLIAPVYSGDTITVSVMVEAVRRAAEGRRGIVTTRHIVRRVPTGDMVASYVVIRMIRGRDDTTTTT